VKYFSRRYSEGIPVVNIHITKSRLKRHSIETWQRWWLLKERKTLGQREA